ncbi:unnamed protein product [Orchesella dallaii]|uniref:Uncharacterized protein n=1 Tax=Orchesella dallaii TaxID=48710 RepID=A0ABP1QQ38_9HEXA
MKFVTVVLFTLLLTTVAYSAKLSNALYKQLEEFECLPPGFPCTPSINSTVEATTAVSTSVEDMEESTTTVIPFVEKTSPISCCTKCLYETGWIDAVCE